MANGADPECLSCRSVISPGASVPALRRVPADGGMARAGGNALAASRPPGDPLQPVTPRLISPPAAQAWLTSLRARITGDYQSLAPSKVARPLRVMAQPAGHHPTGHPAWLRQAAPSTRRPTPGPGTEPSPLVVRFSMRALPRRRQDAGC